MSALRSSELACVTHGARIAKVSDYSNLKMLGPKQMLQRLSKTLVPGKVGNASENVLNEIGQIIYSLYQEKEVTKKVYNNIMNSIKL